MALLLSFFLIILGASALLYLSGMVFKLPYLFLFGCVLLLGSSALLWTSDGLEFGSKVTGFDEGTNSVVYTPTVINMSNVGLAMFALMLVGIPIVSLLVIDTNPTVKRSVSPFHY